MSTVAVTGASGFVGGVVSEALTAAGHRVISLGRRPLPGEYRGYSLEAPITDGTFSDVDAVVHCAYDLTLTDPRDIDRVNVRGTAMLTEAAVQSGARVFLVSSMSAYPGTRQIYGQAKLRCERVVLEAGGEAVRLGLVWGSARGGMIGTLSGSQPCPSSRASAARSTNSPSTPMTSAPRSSRWSAATIAGSPSDSQILSGCRSSGSSRI